MATLPSIRHLQVFVAIARFRSFSRAAQALGMTQSALSQSIAQMEFLLDAALVQRNRRHVTLTASGQAFLPKAIRLLEELGEAVEEIRSLSSPLAGEVAIACMSSTLLRVLPSVVEAFKARFPEVVVHVREIDATAIAREVSSGGVDFAVSVMFRQDAALDFRPLLEDELHFICRHDHRLASRKSMSWTALRKYEPAEFVHWTGLDQLALGAMPPTGIDGKPTYTVSRIPTVFSIVEETGFLSVLPTLALSHPLLGKTFHHAPMVDPTVRRSIGLITPRERPLSPTAATMRNALLEDIAGMAMDALPDVRIVYPPARARHARAARSGPGVRLQG